MTNIGVVGSGAFGTALASVIASKGHDVTLVGRDASQANEINTEHMNNRYLPNIPLPETLHATVAFEALAGADILLLVAPAQVTRDVIDHPVFQRLDCPVLTCAKGIESATGKTQTQVFGERFPNAIVGALSGPGFAREIATGRPTALTLGIQDDRLGKTLQETLSTKSLRLYLSNDPLGVELGGALKNVFAIASGIVSGADLGESAQAALLTRGFAELKALASAMGAQSETLAGLSGFGDLVLSCTSRQSRNFSFGYQVGKAADFSQTSTVEGIASSKAVVDLAKLHGVSMPICQAVSAVLEKTLSIEEALYSLMSRPLKKEV